MPKISVFIKHLMHKYDGTCYKHVHSWWIIGKFDIVA